MPTTKKLFILCPYPHGKAPSQRFRFEQYLPWLREQGWEIEQAAFLSDEGWEVLYLPGKQLQKIMAVMAGFFRRIHHVFKARKYALVMIHREASPIGPPVVEWFIARVLKKPVIYDFDDAIWMPDAKRGLNSLKCYGKIPNIIQWSTTVSAGNDYLANYAAQHNANVVVNPTTIDMEKQGHQRKVHNALKPVVVGWTGSHSTLRYLNQLTPVLKKLTEEGVIELLIISNKKPEIDVDYRFLSWNAASEVEDLLQMDIGIMPLEDSEWAKGKCGFKALQYMSLGIPALVSPVGTNQKVVQHQVSGYWCQTSAEWEEAIRTLAADEGKRQAMGNNAFSFIRQAYATEANRMNMLTILDEARRRDEPWFVV